MKHAHSALAGRRRLLRAAAASPMGWLMPASAATRQVSRSAPPAQPAAARAALLALGERHFGRQLDADPLWASFLGLATPEQASRLPMEIAPAERQRQRNQLLQTQGELARLDLRGLSEADRISADTLRHQLADSLAWLGQPTHLMPLDPMGDNPLVSLAGAAENGLNPFATRADHEHHLHRLRQLPAWCAQAMANLREGQRTGVVQPAALVQRLLPQLATLGEVSFRSNPFFQPLLRIPDTLSAADQNRLRQAYAPVLGEQVLPAVRALARYVAEDYLPRARTTAGLGALPGGAAWYAQAVRSATTTSLTHERIHALGLREVQRLQARMHDLRERMGFAGSLTGFFAWQAAQPTTCPFRTEEEVLAAYRVLDARIGVALPRLFHRQPQAALDVRLEPPLTRDAASDHYQPPAADGSRPGVFYAVVRNAATYPCTGMATLLLHEGRPGHHTQIALAHELSLPRFQRYAGFDAYAEGWALYAETLGYEMGLFEDDNAHLGHLRDAMLRAVRLVVDTGLHAQGWGREQAIDYLVEHTGYDPEEARAQVERYMAMPGQALSYAVGKQAITVLRDAARSRLGEAFSLPDFHEQVLGSGALPLAVLSGKINRWVAAKAPPSALLDGGPPQVVAPVE